MSVNTTTLNSETNKEKALSPVLSLAFKEMRLYFQTPVAYIFMACFLFVSLFVFFWVEKFFARNIVDVRPLFSWMPLLLIFLVSALSMKMWSEETKIGTIEFLRTMPVKTSQLVLGKFLACFSLCSFALLLTLTIPISVSLIGDLDWGPVIGGYVATFLLAAAYSAIGLYASSKSDNQIVSLILSILLCSFFFILGSPVILSFFGQTIREILSLFSTNSHFTSIERGIFDFRDIFFYISLTAVFIALNVLAIERKRWSEASKERSSYYKSYKLAVILLVTNLLVGNIWINKTRIFRLDLTEGQQYTISSATEKVINSLQEPMLIRGYFSDKTHPLLAPLVVQIKDLLKEFQVESGSKLRVEFINPINNPELEAEANRKYNIKPVPFQFADKYQSSLVNSYFNILIQYGDEYKVLGFQDLIEIKQMGEANIDVRLRNLEYDITSNMKKVVYGFQSTESIFASLNESLTLTAYVSEDEILPEQILALKTKLIEVSSEFTKLSEDKFKLELINPLGNDNKVANDIAKQYGFKPMALSLFSGDAFYFYLILKQGNKEFQIALPQELNPEVLKTSIENGIKRFAPGFTKTIGLYTPPVPPQNPMMARMGMGQKGKQFNFIRESLSQTYNVEKLDLAKGEIPSMIDIAIVLAPENLSQKEVFAVDQFLMRGGTVVLSTSTYSVENERGSIDAKEHKSGLENWLAHNGINLKKGMVYDLQNEPYPVPVKRNLGGFSVQEIKLINYPLFPDVRGDKFNEENAITSYMNQVTLNWPTAIEFTKADSKINETKLLRSSDNSWFSENPQIKPDFNAFPELGFKEEINKESSLIGALYSGEFTSFFKGEKSPLIEEEKLDEKATDKKDDSKKPSVTTVIEKSNPSANLIVYASNDFLADNTLQISASSGSDRYRNSLLLINNTVDWSLEDRDLLSIKSRGKFSRTIMPMEETSKRIFEYSNYLAVLALLFLVYLLAKFKRNSYNANLKACLA